MFGNYKNKWINYWPLLLAVPLGIILLKTIPKTAWFKNLEKRAKIMTSISIDAKLADNKLSLLIKNSSHYSFKDLTITCNYVAVSGTNLGGDELTIYQAFFRGSKETIQNLESSKMPDQTYSITCSPINFIELSDEEERKLEKQLIDKIFGTTQSK